MENDVHVILLTRLSQPEEIKVSKKERTGGKDCIRGVLSTDGPLGTVSSRCNFLQV